MAKRRRLCNYAHASEEVPQKGAMYQRGQFYIVEDNKRKGDRRRYRVMINESLLGFGGSLVRVKRFVNDMYKGFPFAEDVGDDMADKVRRFGRRAQMEIRPQFQPSKQKQTSTGKKATRRPTAKKSTGESVAVRFTEARWRKLKRDSEKARSVNDMSVLVRINAELAQRVPFKPQAIPRLIRENQQTIDAIQSTPSQGRLF